MSENTRKRRTTTAALLVGKFQQNLRIVEKLVWEDEQNFAFCVLINSQMNCAYSKSLKSDVDKNLLHQVINQIK